jgi:hypothetical protein
METLNLTACKIMTFIPSGENFEKAIQFYKEIGFIVDSASESFAVFSKDQCKFFLQRYPNEWIQGNLMMALEVQNLDDWWTMLSGLGLEEKYENVKITPPQVYPWGVREAHLVDLCGVFWHIAEA